MEVAGTGSPSQGCGVLDAETSTNSYINSSVSDMDQPRKLVCSRQHIGFAAGGKNALAAGGNDVFESLL